MYKDFWFLTIDYAGAFFSLMAVGKCPVLSINVLDSPLASCPTMV